jgi:GTP pyrophosphokinase
MHHSAEYGVAAHWKYKQSALTPNLEWLNELKTQNEQSENVEEFYEFAKNDLYSEDIAVYSPKGDLFTLPRGATVLDFAYAVHTEIGDYAQAALVNKHKSPLLSELKNGDIINIITSNEPIYRCSWVNSVKTSKAKNAIISNCKTKIKNIDKKIAINLLLSVFGIRKQRLLELLRLENFKKIYLAASDVEYLQEVINHLKKYLIHQKILPPILRQKFLLRKQIVGNIEIHSIHKINSVLFDYCCHPKKGDDIVGFRRFSEVTVHHKLCSNAAKRLEKNESTVFVKWSNERSPNYQIIVSIENYRGSLAKFLQDLAKMGINILTIDFGKSETSQADYFKLVVELDKKSDKDDIRQRIASRYKLIDFSAVDDIYK